MRLRTWIVAVALLVLQACATQEESPQAGSGALVGAYTPQAGLSPKERFREALYLLEEGAPVAARAELVIYLQHQPDSEIGRDLLRQIDLPSRDYFPEESRPVELMNGASLSTLSKQYLGSLYQFYALAKYNGIDQPRKITVGQSIEIPLTDQARQAFAAVTAQPTPPPQAETVPEQAESADASEPEPVIEQEPAPEQNAAVTDSLYREGLNAYRAQDLDRAIDLWDQVLVLEPEHENARLYRAQAVELREKLSTLN